jgi:hypothetical protein
MARIVKSVGTFLNSVFRGKEESSSIDAVYVHPRLIGTICCHVNGMSVYLLLWWAHAVVGEPQKRVLAETKGRQRSNISEELSNFLVHRHGHNFMLWNLSYVRHSSKHYSEGTWECLWLNHTFNMQPFWRPTCWVPPIWSASPWISTI